MRFLLATIVMVMVLFKGAISSSLNAPNNQNQIPVPPKVCDKVPVNNCNCHCNLHQDPRIGEAIKTLEAKMERLIEMVNRTSTLQPFPQPATFVSSCREQYEKDNTSKSQVYPLKFGPQMVPVYCHMGDFGCGDGGWTLAMKTDGTKRTFHFDSNLWSDRVAYNLKGGETGFDTQETKLPTYWNTPFSKICLGMRVGQQARFVVVNKQANSLFSLIADGRYRNISLGRNAWNNLIGPTASLQTSCNREGFNTESNIRAFSRARIGILGNNENDCTTCDSRIGFGTGGRHDDSNTCGNEADSTGDKGEKHLKAMGYILVN